MRREYLDLSYKDRTSEIIRSRYNEWQLAFQECREFAHILTNRVTSVVEDLGNEITYVENMFFPDMMDINEEWLTYEASGIYTADSLFISGSPVSEVLAVATSFDEFIAGPYDHFDIISSGEIGFNVKHGCCLTRNIAFLSDNYLKIINPVTNQTTTSELYLVHSGETVLYVNKGDIDFPFSVEMENITVTDNNGAVVNYSYINRDSCKGEYLEKFDTDRNGIINKRELYYLQSYKGKSSSQYEPGEWDKIKWMDVDADGEIGQTDYNYITSLIPAMRGDIKSALSLPVTSVGAYTVNYDIKVPRSSVIVQTSNDNYTVLYNDHPLVLSYSKLALDQGTNIVYGISIKNNRVYANRIDSNFNIVSSARIFVNTNLEPHTMVDVCVHCGYLFILTRYNNKYYIYYEDVRKEYIEYIERRAQVELTGCPDITGLMIDDSGYFYLYNNTTLFRVKAHRNKYIEMNDTVYTNIEYPMTNLSGDPVVVLPWTIFNSFDSFAFSLGIERPAGCDNIRMKELIYDFWKYQQDNTAIGINYGIKRDIGITNTPNSFEAIRYILPAEISGSGDIYINDVAMTSYAGQNTVTISGTPGVFILSGGDTIIPQNTYYDTNTSIKLSAGFIDNNGDIQDLTYNIILADKHSLPDIEVYSLGDREYVASTRCPYSSGEIAEIVTDLESTDPSIYMNMKTDMYPLGNSRVSAIPMIPTLFGTAINLSGDSIIQI